MGGVFVLDSHANQGLVTIRSLGSKGLDVTAGSPRRWTAGRFSKYVDRHVTYPSSHEDPEEFVDTIVQELKRGDYDMLLPVEGGTVQTTIKYKSRFEEYTTVPFLPYEQLKVGLNKQKTIEAARELDIPHPKTIFSDENNEKSIDAIGDTLGYPVVVKPAEGDGRRGVSICNSPKRLEQVAQQTHKSHGSFLFQEFIPHGGERGVYTFYNRSGELSAVTVQKRLRSSPPEGGASTYRETIEDPALVSLSDEFLSGLDWQGVAMVEFRIDSRTNQPKLMEINPRLWGSLALSVYAGVDFPYLLYRLSIGDDIEPDLTYKSGVQARRLIRDFKQVLQREDRLRAIHEFLTPAAKPCCYDVMSLRDPLPTFGHICYCSTVVLER